MKTLTCKQCGVRFLPTGKPTSLRRYCNVRCRKRAQKARYHPKVKQRTRRKKVVTTCKQCGVQFCPAGTGRMNSHYCDNDCRLQGIFQTRKANGKHQATVDRNRVARHLKIVPVHCICGIFYSPLRHRQGEGAYCSPECSTKAAYQHAVGYRKRMCESLSDSYLKHLVVQVVERATMVRLTHADIPPGLIAAKREVLRVKRGIIERRK